MAESAVGSGLEVVEGVGEGEGGGEGESDAGRSTHDSLPDRAGLATVESCGELWGHPLEHDGGGR